jgi:malonyl-CoA/methylmalonyl-CoA synthetase
MSWLETLRARWRPDHPAVVSPAGSWTYRELDARIRRAAGWLEARGIGRGDVVALQIEDRPTFLVLHLAALGLGAVSLPLNTTYPARELDFYLSDAGARLAVLVPDRLPDLAPTRAALVPADAALTAEVAGSPQAALPEALPADRIGVLLYTSGTTGRPKGALLGHDNLQATVDALHQAWRWSPDDVLLHMLPLFHVHGLFVAMHAALRAGATVHLAERFDPDEAIHRMAHDGITVFMGVPTFYARLLARPPAADPDLSGMRLFTSGSAPLPARDHRAFQARYGHTILERYGMTEVGIVLSNPYEGERRPGAVGMPVPGARVRVVDPRTGQEQPQGEVGEIRIAGPSVFKGYLGLPERTAEAIRDGWMCSGDLGFVDIDGYVHVVGRSKDMVLSGGLNVYPSEVEAVLLEDPTVAAAAVVGVPDPDLGERVVASVVAAPGATPDPEALRRRARASLAPYKVPKRIDVVKALPRNAMGKVRKAALRERWSRVRCRPARPDEAEAIAAWNRAMARETEGLALDRQASLEGARRVFRGDVGAFYVIAEVAGERVGQCMITVEWSDWRARPVWWFQSVYVPPAWRRRGVFRALYAHVEARARAEGAAGLRLYVDRRNQAARAVYRAIGMSDEHYDLFELLFDEPPGDPTFRGAPAGGSLPPEA